MLSFINNNKSVVGTVLVAAGAGYLLGMFVGQEKLEEVSHSTVLETTEQLAVLNTLTEVMSRGGADEVTEKVIKDCSSAERMRFDDLLGRLGAGLSRAELVEVSRLFDRCGSFYSQQRAVMAARFMREVEVFKRAAARQSLLVDDNAAADLKVEDWQQLAELETSQSDLFARLVQLQGEIISALLDGEASTGTRTTTLLAEVKEVLEMQSYNVLKMNEVRDRLPTVI